MKALLSLSSKLLELKELALVYESSVSNGGFCPTFDEESFQNLMEEYEIEELEQKEIRESLKNHGGISSKEVINFIIKKIWDL